MDTLRKRKKEECGLVDRELLAHLNALSLSSIDDYLTWCTEHGFGRRTNKHWRLRQKELDYAKRSIAETHLARKKQEVRKPERMIERIFRGELHAEDVTEPYLKTICGAYRSSLDSRKTRLALEALVQHVLSCSDLLTNEAMLGNQGWQTGHTYIEALLALARHSRAWIRRVADWKPHTHNVRRQFSSLVRHLLAEWPVPAFMESVWFAGNGTEAVRRQGWYLHIARGKNIRTADLPLRFTKRMAHHFLEAPADLSVDEALRWGQIRALGGNERLVRAIVGTSLSTEFANGEFWSTVLAFFIANPMLDLVHSGPIIDYIRHQRYTHQNVFVAPGVVERRGPAQPNFTMRGRTPEALLRQVERWHHALAKEEEVAQRFWPASGIAGFEFVEGTAQSGNQVVWTITELLSSSALAAEGRKMKHCVATYTHSCARGNSSIWTLEAETFEGRTKQLTIEVLSQTRSICQARGACNRPATEKELGILRRWTAAAGLKLARYL